MLGVVLGEDHVKCASSMAGLAKVYYKLGQYQEGKQPTLFAFPRAHLLNGPFCCHVARPLYQKALVIQASAFSSLIISIN